MLDFEQTIQERLNQAGVVATKEALQQFDIDGSPLTVGSVKLTSKGQLSKEYQTPYGVATVARHVYQSSQGGKTYCPLDRDARIVVSSTPRFAKMIAHKYAEFGSGRVLIDLEGGPLGSSRTWPMRSPPWLWPRRSRGTTPCPRWTTRSRPSRWVWTGRAC